MSNRSYFTVKKRDASEDELEVVIPTSMAESIKAELQRTGGARVKRSIDGEGGTTEKKEARTKRLPLKKAKIRKYTAENATVTNSRDFPRQYRCVAALWHDRLYSSSIKTFLCIIIDLWCIYAIYNMNGPTHPRK